MDKKIKVLFLASWYPNRIHPFEGIFIERHAEVVSKYCEVAVLYFVVDSGLRGKHFEIIKEEKNGIHSVKVYAPPSGFRIPLISSSYNVIRYFFYINRGLKEIKLEFGKFNLIQVNVASRIGLFAVLYKLFKKIPYVVLEHSSSFISGKTISEYKKKTSFGEKVITSVNYAFSNSIIAVSKYLGDAIKDKKRIQKKIEIVPNFINIPGNPESYSKCREKVKILTIALLNEDKNISPLISAVDDLLKEGLDLELNIIGDGPGKKMLEQQTNQLGILNKNIFFRGFVPNDKIKEYYKISNFFVLPSKYETFSIVTAEAIAHGLPVVITKCGGPEEYVNKEQGIILEGNDQSSIKNGIMFMYKNWEKYDPVELWKYAARRFNAEEIGKALTNIYSEVLND